MSSEKIDCWANKESVDHEKAFQTILDVLRSFGRRIGPKEEEEVRDCLRMVQNVSQQDQLTAATAPGALDDLIQTQICTKSAQITAVVTVGK